MEDIREYETMGQTFKLKPKVTLTEKILRLLGSIKLKMKCSCCKSNCTLNEEENLKTI
jgi:hypothetical protein